MTSTKSPWRLSGDVGTFATDSLQIEVGLSNLSDGLRNIVSHGKAVESTRPLRIFSEATPLDDFLATDVFVRGNDLIASFSAPEDDLSIHIYWRFIKETRGVYGIELIVSLQTNLLDIHVDLSCQTEITSSAVFWLDSRESFRKVINTTAESPQEVQSDLLLFTDICDGFSYAEAKDSHSDPAFEITVHERGQPAITRHRLMNCEIEKGVIWLSRSLGLFVPSAVDISATVECFQRFRSRPLPLTA